MSDQDLLRDAYRAIARARAKAPLTGEEYSELVAEVDALAARASFAVGIHDCTGEQIARLDPAAQRFVD